jgi:hypothetical protein
VWVHQRTGNRRKSIMEEILAKSEDELDFLGGSGDDILQAWDKKGSFMKGSFVGLRVQ